VQLTEDRQKYAGTIFEEGVKALSPQEREQIGDIKSFRMYANLKAFTDHYGWALLSDADRAALGKPAALASGITTEKIAFFEHTGLPLLRKEQQDLAAAIPSSELSDSRAFMLRYGREVASQFLANAAIGTALLSGKCTIAEEDRLGSLIQGAFASCSGEITVRSSLHELTIELHKSGGNWKVARVSPEFYSIADAYPPPPPRHGTAGQQSSSVEAVSTPSYAEQTERLLMPSIPSARWEMVPEKFGFRSANPFWAVFLPKSIWLALWVLAIVALIVVKTVNFRRRLLVNEEPTLLNNETTVKTILVRNFLSRSSTLLTDHRVVQSRTWWWVSRRTADSMPIGDVQAIFWQRWMNWPLILIAVYLIGHCNPAALVLLMIGLEAKIYSIVFKRSFFHLPNSGIAVRSTRRKQFSELWGFFQFAQLQWVGRRSDRPIAPEATTYSDIGPDRDFQLGSAVWSMVGLAAAISLVQRFTGHITLYDNLLGPALLALPIFAGRQRLRDGILTAIFGLSAILTMKFPEFNLIPALGDSDGGTPNPTQYFVIFVAFCVIGVIAGSLSRIAKPLAPLALALWLAFAAYLRPQDLRDPVIYARVTLAAFVSVILCIAYAAILDRRAQVTVATPAASGASAGIL
jgi:hypothetical protein